MLNKFQSFDAIKNQILRGTEYYRLLRNTDLLGYCSIQKEDDILFISKIYVSKEYRGQKNGGHMLSKLEQIANDRGLSQLRLTVNKNNSKSIEFYKHQGFEVKRALTIDIGQGFVMDDYEMVKNLAS